MSPDHRAQVIRALDRAYLWLVLRRSDGQDMIATAHLKAVEEASELAADPTSLEEFADTLICLRAVAGQNRWTSEQIAEAIDAKVTKNQDRTWAQNEDGTWSHVPPPEETPQPV